MSKETKWKLPLIIMAAVIALTLLVVFVIQSSQNKAINLEEAVYTAKSDINVQEEARVSKVYNLADCVKQYDKHEAEILKSLAEDMSAGNNLEDVNTALAAVTYAYPELKSSDNYKQLMNELSIIENTLAHYRENYNDAVEKYNRYAKRFPARNFLELTEYEVQNFQRLEYDAPVEAPRDLFGE